MALPTGNRDALKRRIQRQLPRDSGQGFGSLSEADLAAAVDAVDDFCDTIQASFNSAIPQPARSVLSSKSKAWLFMYVVAERAGIAT